MIFTIKIDARMVADDMDAALDKLALHFSRLALDPEYVETVFEPESRVQIYGEKPPEGI
jgi:hypothetical protein